MYRHSCNFYVIFIVTCMKGNSENPFFAQLSNITFLIFKQKRVALQLTDSLTTVMLPLYLRARECAHISAGTRKEKLPIVKSTNTDEAVYTSGLFRRADNRYIDRDR